MIRALARYASVALYVALLALVLAGKVSAQDHAPSTPGGAQSVTRQPGGDSRDQRGLITGAAAVDETAELNVERPVHLELFARRDRAGWSRGLYNQEIGE